MPESNTSFKDTQVPNTSLELMQEIKHRVPWVDIKDEQLEALDALDCDEKAGKPASLTVMAPGTGKTIVMAADLRRKLLSNPSSRAIFLNDNNDILGQARQTFEEIVGPEFSYGTFGGDGRDYDELSVLMVSFQVMRLWRDAFLPDEFAYGYVDEGHRGYATTYKPTIDYFNFAHLAGFTATPDRMDIKDIRDIFGEESYSLPLEKAIARRLLAAVDYYVYMDEIAETGLVIDIEGNEYSTGQLNKTIYVPKRDEEIADIIKYKGAELDDRKTIIFCRSVEHALRMAELFNDGVAWHSLMSRKMQKDVLAGFKANEFGTLVTIDKANEGIDIPNTTQVVFLRETGSKRIFLQELGRGLRKTKGGYEDGVKIKPKQRVQALDFVGNHDRPMMVDRVWRDIAREVGAIRDDESEIFEVDVNRVHFDQTSLKLLPVLRKIASKVYSPGQADVPFGSVRVSTLANELSMSRGAMKAVITDVDAYVGEFPTLKGQTVAYVSFEDAERIRRAYNTMLQSIQKRP